MANIAKVQLTDTIDFQRQRINDLIDQTNVGSSNIIELDSEANLPSVTSASTNMYLIKQHSSYKGAVLATIVNNTYKYAPLKTEIINGNTYVYVTASQLGSGVSLNKLVYIDSAGVWQVADSTNLNKRAIGIMGMNNAVILAGVVYSNGFNLNPGTTYYYNNTGSVTSTPTMGRIGLAIDSHTLVLHIEELDEEQKQADWNQDDDTQVDYIKNKPGVVSKTAAGFAPQLPNETTVTKFLRQDGTWQAPVMPSMTPTITTVDNPSGNVTLKDSDCTVLTHSGSNTIYINPPSGSYNTAAVRQTMLVFKRTNGNISLSNFKWTNGQFPVVLTGKMYIFVFQQLYDGNWYGTAWEEN